MSLIVSLEYRFDSDPDGAVWTQTTFDYAFWTRYLEVFDQVRVIARIKEHAAHDIPGNWKRADGPAVSFINIPHYIGPLQYLANAKDIRLKINSIDMQYDAVIMRVGSQLAARLEPKLHRTGHPYGLEVLGDPYDVFAPGAVTHPLRPFFRWWFSRQLKRQCAHASAVAYVTESYLQQRYPAGTKNRMFFGAATELSQDSISQPVRTYTTHFSSIELPEEGFVQIPRRYAAQCEFILIHVGSMAQFYKGHDILIETVGRCRAKGWNIRLRLLGDGKHREELETLVQKLELGAYIEFLGEIPAGQRIREQLEMADIFVMPSRTEGLPRAMIEAMARGLPCIGSTVGGIPELLPDEDMVPPNDVDALAQKIMDVLDNPERMTRMSARNLEKAKEYRAEILQARRRDFYQHLKEITETWIQAKERA